MLFRFPCGRWLGRDVDDGSTERLLVGEPCQQNKELPLECRTKTPPRARSPSVPRRAYEIRMSPAEIQQLLGIQIFTAN